MPFAPQQLQDNLPQWYQQLVQNYLQLSQQNAGIGANAPQERALPAPDRRLAPIPPDIHRASQMGRQQPYQRYYQRSERMLEPTAQRFPERMNDYMNPFMNQVVNRIGEEGQRTFRERILPEIEGQFVKLGRYGGMGHQKMLGHAMRDLQNDIMSKQSEALAKGYQQSAQIFNADQTRQLEAAREMGVLGGVTQASHMADIQALMDQGRYLQQQEQARRDMETQEYLRQMELPRQRLAEFGAALSGANPGAVTHEYLNYQTPGTASQSGAGAFGNAALGALGLLRQIRS